MENVVVFFGGQSVEHDVSIITGVMTANALRSSKYNPIPVFVDRSGCFYTGEQLFEISNYQGLNLKKLKKVSFVAGSKILYELKGNKQKGLAVISAGVNCVHGQPGEDGALSGLMELCAIPFASPDALASAVCMDKTFTKVFLKGINVKALPSVTVSSMQEYQDLSQKPSFPVIVKPTKLGSSIGISKADNLEQLHNSINLGLKYGRQVIIEPFVKNFIEINCAVYKKSSGEVVVSECEQPSRKGDLLSFEDKYKSGERVFPADVSKKLSDKVKRITAKIYNNLNASGIIRIDYMIIDGEVYVNEINTVPGSLAYYFFANTLKGFSELVCEMISLAHRTWAEEQTFIKEYKSEILQGGIGKGAKTLVK